MAPRVRRLVEGCIGGPPLRSVDRLLEIGPKMTKRRLQHYVPQFYLRGFVDPNCPDRYEPFVWVYERGRAAPYRRAPKNIAAESHFYSVREGDNKNIEVEERLSILESETAPLWNQLENPTLTLTNTDRRVISEFIACMSNRVPAVRGWTNSVVNDVSKMMLKMLATHYDDLSESQREEIGLSQAALEQAANDGDVRFEASQVVHIRNMLYVIPRLAPIIQEMRWAFLHAAPERIFFTSDRPVVLVNPQVPPGVGGAGFGVKGVEVTLPVSANTCLFLTWDGPVGHVDVREDVIRNVNLRTGRLAHQQAFASTRLRWLSELLSDDEGDEVTPAD